MQKPYKGKNKEQTLDTSDLLIQSRLVGNDPLPQERCVRETIFCESSFDLDAGNSEVAENPTSQAVVLLASRYAAASSLRIYLRYDCEGVPGTIVVSDPIVNDRATQAHVRGRFCPREQVRRSGDLKHPA